jgi:predicted permease
MANLRLVLRGLLRTPLFTGVAVLSLALGIGANTAVFSLLDQVLLRTLPVKNPGELVYLYSPSPRASSWSGDEEGGPSFNFPTFLALQKEQTAFAGLAGAFSVRATLSYKNEASYGDARIVSGNYFDLLGVQPAIGRLLIEDDDRVPAGRPVAVLSYQYWTLHFGSDISVLNQTMLVNGSPLTVVGVAERGFTGERVGRPADVFVPISMKKAVTPGWRGNNDRADSWIALFARLKRGVTRAHAESEINILYHAQLDQDAQLVHHPRSDFLNRFRAMKIVLKPGQYGRGGLRDRERQPLLLLMGMTGLVLLIACTNVANLQLARGAARTREAAVRIALGESRARLIGELLFESCTISAAGGICGLIAAQSTLRGIIAAIPPLRELRQVLTADLDGRVLLFCLGVSAATGVLFGLFPALQAAKIDLLSALKEQAGQLSATRSTNLFRKVLVSVQVAISLLLLISAGLFARTLVKLTTVNPGLQVDHLISFSVVPKLSGYTNERAAQLHDQLTDRLAAIPGVKLVTSTDTPPITGDTSGTYIQVPGYKAGSDDVISEGYILCETAGLGASYFATMGTQLLAGREFTRADNLGTPKVAVVNEVFAKHFFGGQNPIGRYIDNSGKIDIQIVGLVKDARYDAMRHAIPPLFFSPIGQRNRWREFSVYLRTSIDPAQLAPTIRREVRKLDPTMPIGEISTAQTQIDRNIFDERLAATLTSTFAGLATVLAAIGIYGVLAFNVARRTREIGIRMALGAGPGQVRSLVGREMSLMLAVGSVGGILAAEATGRLIQSYLYEMKAWDLSVYIAAAVVLWSIAVGAAYVPARRATSVDPMVALRCE